jgi:hypothetical protein
MQSRPPAPRFVQPRPARPAGGQGTAALWLGIASIVICVLSVGVLALLTLPLGIAALVLGIKARRRGAGNAGLILGAIGVLLSLLALLFWVVLVIIGGFTLEFLDFWDQIEGWLELPAPEDPTDPDPPII